MLICKKCKTQPICKIFEQREKLAPAVTISVDKCKYFNSFTNEENPQHDFTALKKRIETIKTINRERELMTKNIDEIHTCESCQSKKHNCYKCDDCGKWVCEDCATTTPDNKVLCMECFNDKAD